MPAHQWLIAALCDETTNKNRVELELNSDLSLTMKRYEEIELKQFPYSVDLVFEWIDISKIETGVNFGSDALVEISIASHIRKRRGELDSLRALAFLLDRNLLINNNMKDMFTCIVKYRFFDPVREPTHFMCCFGDTPESGMRCSLSSNNICKTYGWCAKCKSDDILAKCKHTCYWHLIGLMLGAYPVPRPNPHTNKTINAILPEKYTY